MCTQKPGWIRVHVFNIKYFGISCKQKNARLLNRALCNALDPFPRKGKHGSLRAKAQVTKETSGLRSPLRMTLCYKVSSADSTGISSGSVPLMLFAHRSKHRRCDLIPHYFKNCIYGSLLASSCTLSALAMRAERACQEPSRN